VRRALTLLRALHHAPAVWRAVTWLRREAHLVQAAMRASTRHRARRAARTVPLGLTEAPLVRVVACPVLRANIRVHQQQYASVVRRLHMHLHSVQQPAPIVLRASTHPPLGRLHHRLALPVLLDPILLRRPPPAPVAPLEIFRHRPEPAHAQHAPLEVIGQQLVPQAAPIARQDIISRTQPSHRAALNVVQALMHQHKQLRHV